jgi:hypothetical protein
MTQRFAGRPVLFKVGLIPAVNDRLGEEICLATSNAQIVSLALFKSMCNTADFFQ